MHVSDFDFELPRELIAQKPSDRRGDSKLLVIDRNSTACTDTTFSSFNSFLRQGDLLVVNDSKVIPARLLGVKPSGGKVEVLLVRSTSDDLTEWLAMTRSSKPLRVGALIDFGHGFQAEILGEAEDQLRRVALRFTGDLNSVLERVGKLPLPPYIRREPEDVDIDRYQTVFARAAGSVAAPTAGLHFTPEVLKDLRGKGVLVESLTLHVGPGTFLPVRVDKVSEHRMHREFFDIPAALAAQVNEAKKEGRRVVAVGTTTTRALESACDESGGLIPGPADTDIFISPGYRFKVVDALVTNFHLPCSTLLMLVAAFAGHERILEAYRHAVAKRYRFFSYGDCMLIS
jgi:S-adenosylmethionine:tRNA ribosyltransferase-isomerase